MFEHQDLIIWNLYDIFDIGNEKGRRYDVDMDMSEESSQEYHLYIFAIRSHIHKRIT